MIGMKRKISRDFNRGSIVWKFGPTYKAFVIEVYECVILPRDDGYLSNKKSVRFL